MKQIQTPRTNRWTGFFCGVLVAGGMQFANTAFAAADVTSVTDSKDPVFVGETFVVTVTVRNTASSSAIFDIGLEIDAISNLQILTANYGSQSFTAGQTRSFDFNVKANSSGVGNYYGKAKIHGNLFWDDSLTGQVTVQTDTTPPSTPGTPDMASTDDTGESSSDNVTKNIFLNFSWTGSTDSQSGVAGYEWRLDSGSWGWNGTSTSVYAGLPTGIPEGAHSISVRAKNNAGLYSTVSSLSFTVDTTPPTAPGSLSPSGDVTTQRPVLSWSSVSGAVRYKVTVWLNEGAFPTLWENANVTGTSVTLGADAQWEKQYGFNVTAYDLAGNASTSANSFFRPHDTSAPSQPAQILVPSVALISPIGSNFVFPIRVQIPNNGSAINTESRIRVRGSRYNNSQVEISEAGPHTSLFSTQVFAGGFDFVIPSFPASTSLWLEARIVFRAPALDNQANAGRMLWEIQGTIGTNAWPAVSGSPAGSLWPSGLSGRVWQYETALFPRGLPSDTSGVDVQGACPTAIAIGNGIFTACLSKEGKVVFAAYPTVGSYTQIPYETRPWDFCAKNFTASAQPDDWAHDFGAPFPTGVFPGVRAIPSGTNRAPISWLNWDEWNRAGWKPRHAKHASPTGVQTYRSLDERLEIKETAVVPFNSHSLVRILEIKNLSSQSLNVSPLCSALLNLNKIDQSPYLAEFLVDNVLNWDWKTNITSLNSNSQLIVFNTTDVPDVFAAIGARWLSDPVASPSPIQGVKARFLEVGFGRDIARGILDKAGWDTYYRTGALAEISDLPLADNDIEATNGVHAPAVHQGVVEWQAKAIAGGGTQSVALVLAFGRTEDDAKASAVNALFSVGSTPTALPDQVDGQWETWLRTTEWNAIDSNSTNKGLSTAEVKLLARCLSTIHMLQNQPPGGSPYSNALGSIIASPNLSPKYYPVWPRDAYFQSLALRMARLTNDAEQVLSWIYRSHVRRDEIVPGNIYWSQAYNPRTGENVGLPGAAILAYPGWGSLVKTRMNLEIDVVEKDQVAIAVLGAVKFHERESRLPNGVAWSDIEKACSFLVNNAKQWTWMPSDQRLLEPSIDFGEDPRYDTALWQFGNMAAVKALESAAPRLNSGLSNQCVQTANQIRNGLEARFWDGNELYDKLVYPPPGSGWTVNSFPSNPVTNVPKTNRLQKLNTFYYWPFGFYPPQANSPLGSKAFINFTNSVWPVHDLGVPVIQADGSDITRAQWSVTLLSSVVTSRLLGNRADWPGPSRADYLLQKIVGSDARDTYLTEAGYVPDVFVAGFPGAAASSVPLGWSHSMMAVALLQKAGVSLPYWTDGLPILSNPRLNGAAFTVSIWTQPGSNYVWETKTLLGDANWTPVQTNAGTGGLITFTNPAVTGPSRFYRVHIQ